MSRGTTNAILEQLQQSKLFQEYERAFTSATGLPLTLTRVDDWQLAHGAQDRRNSVCMLLAEQNKGRAACLRSQSRVTEAAEQEACTVECFAGLCESAIPLHVGEQLIGYLRTGEISTHDPTEREFQKLRRRLQKLGVTMEEAALRQAYFGTPRMPALQYRAMVQMLRVFADHLGIVANQIAVQQQHADPPGITRARHHIESHYTDDLTLGEVAEAAHMSRFYFCKYFKKATGLNFNEYLSRVRVEKARERLLHADARVSEVAFEVGFQSLTQFNRMFKKLTGETPSHYRSHAR